MHTRACERTEKHRASERTEREISSEREKKIEYDREKERASAPREEKREREKAASLLVAALEKAIFRKRSCLNAILS